MVAPFLQSGRHQLRVKHHQRRHHGRGMNGFGFVSGSAVFDHRALIRMRDYM